MNSLLNSSKGVSSILNILKNNLSESQMIFKDSPINLKDQLIFKINESENGFFEYEKLSLKNSIS